MAHATAFTPITRSLTVGRYKLAVYSQPGAQTVVYVHHGSNDFTTACRRAYALAAAGETPPAPFAIVGIDGVDWNRDLAPWPAPKVFQSGDAFFGGADAYLSILLSAILPAAEAVLDAPVEVRALAGYSMGGLFALYAMYQTDRFRRFCSMSGSLWFDGFLDYMRAQTPKKPPERVYLSLGSTEKRTNNPRLALVEACTLEAQALLVASGVPTVYLTHPGGHSAEVPERLARGVLGMV